MATERLHFAEGEIPYHFMHFADHLIRYSYLRSICVGKNVLDVACGEGYGSYLLSKWGAASVTGVDISSEAIAKAKSIFAADNVSYVVGDVGQLEHFLPKNSKFDIICSFETIKHVRDPKAFLLALASLRTDQGIVVISTPNDHILTADQDNPYHLRRYTYASLKEETEAILGPATSWLLGTPIQGYTLIKEATATPVDADFCFDLKGKAVGTFHLIPPNANTNLETNSALFWLGTWGNLPMHSPILSVAAPLPIKAFIALWQSIGDSKLNSAKDSEVQYLENIIADERRTLLNICQRHGQLQNQLQESNQLNEQLKNQFYVLQLANKSIEFLAGELCKTIAERYPGFRLPYRILIRIWRHLRGS